MNKSDVVAQKMIYLVDMIFVYKNKYLKNPVNLRFGGDISERQFIIMIILWFSHKSTVTTMADIMKISKSALSIILNKMVSKNLIQKEYPKNDDDKRRIYLYLSEEGLYKLNEIKKREIQEFNIMYKLFSNKQKENLSNGVDKLADAIKVKDIKYFDLIYKSTIHNNFENIDEIEKMYIKVMTFFCAVAIQHRELVRFNCISFDGVSLTKNQLFILSCISSLGLNTITKLEKYLYSSGSTVSIAVSKLVQKDCLIKSYAVYNDKRIVNISLTEKGYNVLEKMKQKIKECFTDYINSFSKESIKLIDDALDLLLKVFV